MKKMKTQVQITGFVFSRAEERSVNPLSV